MNDIQQLLESGQLELYVLGALSPEESSEIALAAEKYPLIRQEIEAIEIVMERVASANAQPTPSHLREKVLATFESLSQGAEDPSRPPILRKTSKGTDYAYWLSLDNIAPPAEYENLFFIPIAQNEDGLSAVVWINGHVEKEMHEDSIEKFLVLEGSCQINIEGEVFRLNAGDYLSVPPLLWHTVDVTSDIPCKLIVQRVAA